MWSVASFQISAVEVVGHEVAEQVLQNSSWPSEEEAFAPEKSSLLEESLLTAGNPAIIRAYSVIRAGCRKTQESISMSRQNQIKPHTKKNIIRNVKGLAATHWSQNHTQFFTTLKKKKTKHKPHNPNKPKTWW